MKMNKKERKMVLSMKEQIESWLDGKMNGMSIYLVNECIRVYKGIVSTNNHDCITICQDVKTIYEKLGFKINEFQYEFVNGIGYTISVR